MGLMGGSVVRSLGRLEPRPTLLGCSSELTEVERAREAGVVDQAFLDPEEVIGAASVVVFAVPLGALPPLLERHAGALAEKELVTDVAGLKAPVLRAARSAGVEEVFVGGHPMAGSEASGFSASRADLLDGARVWLSADGAGPTVRRRAQEFWRSVGGDPEWIEAGEHDRAMAWCSHLPQLVSNALAGGLDAAGFRPTDLGPGGRDMVRLAGSSPELWRDLLERSAPEVGLGLESVSRALRTLADLLARRDLDAVSGFMERTRDWRAGGGGEEWS